MTVRAPSKGWHRRFKVGPLILAGGAAVLLGVLAEVLGYLPHPWEYLSQLAYPWLAGAFFRGMVASSWVLGDVPGCGFVATGLAANTAFKWVVSGHDAVRPMLEHESPWWLAATLVLGSGFGAAGWLHAYGDRWADTVAAAVLPGSGAVEVAAILAGVLPWGALVATVVAVLTVSSALILATHLRGPRLSRCRGHLGVLTHTTE